MKLLIVGCGRVGSRIAAQMAEDGHEVTVVDEDPEALQRLPDDWPGTFVVGHGLDIDVLVEARIAEADAAVDLHRRRQHQHRDRPDREDPVRLSLRCLPRARPGPRGVLPDPGPADGVPDVGGDHA